MPIVIPRSRRLNKKQSRRILIMICKVGVKRAELVISMEVGWVARPQQNVAENKWIIGVK